MGMLQKFSDALGLGGKEMNIHEYLDGEDLENLADEEEEASAYVKPVALENPSVINDIKSELQAGNLILLNITPMLKNERMLSEVIDSLKAYTASIKGDIARIDNEKILITPSRMKIVKRRR